MRVVWQCEADEKCRAVLRRHWPGVPCHPDLRSLHAAPDSSERRNGGGGLCGERCGRCTASPDRQQGAFGPVGLFCGGFPCQDLSVAGNRAGLGAERSALFFDLARVASVVLGSAGWLLIENVSGLLSSPGRDKETGVDRSGQDFATVLATLADLGFHDLAWRVLDSRYFGVPQRRRRVFILARRSRGRCAAEVLLEPESGGGNHQASGKAGARVAGTLSHGSSRPGVSAPGRRQEDDENIVNSLDTEGGGVDDNSAQAGHIVGALTRRDGKGPNSDCDNGQILIPEEVGTLRSGSHVIGLDTPERYPLVSPPLTAEGHDASEDGTGRQALVYPTLRTQSRNNSNGGSHARELIEAVDPDREGATPGLPGWLDDPAWPVTCPFDPIPDGPREAQMGNAVTVSVAYWIGRRILEHEEGCVVA
jgi:DNA (cytosine-5)-methyltransferase 1